MYLREEKSFKRVPPPSSFIFYFLGPRHHQHHPPCLLSNQQHHHILAICKSNKENLKQHKNMCTNEMYVLLSIDLFFFSLHRIVRVRKIESNSIRKYKRVELYPL